MRITDTKFIIDYLENLKKLYIQKGNENEKSRLLLKNTIAQIEEKILKLQRIINYIENEIDLSKDNYIRIGDYLKNLDASGKIWFGWSGFARIGFISNDDPNRLNSIRIPYFDKNICLDEAIKEIELYGKRYSYDLNIEISTEDLEDLVINTKWISEDYMESPESTESIYKCITNDRINKIDRKIQFIEQYKTNSKSRIVSIRLGDIINCYEKLFYKIYKINKIRVKDNCPEGEWGEIEYEFSAPDSEGNDGKIYITASKYIKKDYSSKMIDKRFIDLKFNLYNKFYDGAMVKDKHTPRNIILRDRERIKNSEWEDLILDINLDGHYMKDECFFKTIQSCIDNNKVVHSENIDADLKSKKVISSPSKR